APLADPHQRARSRGGHRVDAESTAVRSGSPKGAVAPRRSHVVIRLNRLPLLALVAGISISCAEERPPINRVGPYALDKSFFIGANLADPADDPEFYWRNYVVDGSMSQSLIGIGSWS